MSVTSSNQLFPRDSTWAKDIKDYEVNRQTLAWGTTPKPHIYTKKEQCAKENIFNPISQQYYDKALNSRIKSQEMQLINQKIPEYYDKELRNEQTFDIISLKDRLKGFEDHPSYPKPTKDKVKMNKEISKASYNIISNLDTKTMKLSLEPIKAKQAFGAINKDFNLITNDYFVNSALKKQTEIEIEKLTAAKKLQQTRSDYDYIRCVFYDPVKQSEYEKAQLEEKQKRSLIKSDEKFNPINHYVYDTERVDKDDHAKDNLKKRYKIKPVIEDFYRQREIDREYAKEKQIENKLNYNRFKVQDQRGYDVINMRNNYSMIKDSLSCVNKRDSWQLIKDNAGENETLSKKGVFKDPYDTSEIDQNEHQYKQKRYRILKELGDYDKQFDIKKVTEKKRNIPFETDVNSQIGISIDKGKWFSTAKSVDMSDFKRVEKKNPCRIVSY